MSVSVAAAQNGAIQTVITDIEHGDVHAREAAVQQAALVGTSVIPLLLGLYRSDDPAVVKAASEALRRSVHNACRSGSGSERAAATKALLEGVGADAPRKQRVDSLYLLGFAASEGEADTLAKQLADPDMREYARLALERIPGRKVDAALRTAISSAPSDFRANLELSLKARSSR